MIHVNFTMSSSSSPHRSGGISSCTLSQISYKKTRTSLWANFTQSQTDNVPIRMHVKFAISPLHTSSQHHILFSKMPIVCNLLLVPSPEILVGPWCCWPYLTCLSSINNRSLLDSTIYYCETMGQTNTNMSSAIFPSKGCSCQLYGFPGLLHCSHPKNNRKNHKLTTD